MATLMCVRCDTGAPRCLSVLTAEKRDFPAQVREDGPCQDSRPKGPFRVWCHPLGGVPQKTRKWVPSPSTKPVQAIGGYRPVVDPGEILVLTGPPAAGKSTVATLIAGQWDLSVHLQADYFQVECIRSGYLKPWKPESHAQNTTVARVFTSATAE